MNTNANARSLPRAPRRKSCYVTRQLAQRAVDLAAPMMEMALHDRAIVASGFLYVVVMDPALTPANASFEEAILHEEAFGDRSHWDADYASFARAKARLSWTTARDSNRLLNESPHLLCVGDTMRSGGVWMDGLTVAVSGAMPVYDDVFASAVALWIRALSRNARAADCAGASRAMLIS